MRGRLYKILSIVMVSTFARWQCCEKYIRTQKVTGDSFSSGDPKERSNEPRLTYSIASG
jgi:hypothetical protein